MKPLQLRSGMPNQKSALLWQISRPLHYSSDSSKEIIFALKGKDSDEMAFSIDLQSGP